jgi:hypothetical protein
MSKMRSTRIRLFIGLAAAVVAMGPTAALAQPRIHAIIVADTLDRTIGKSTGQDLGYMVLVLIAQVPRTQLNLKTIDKTRVNAKNILDTIGAATLAADDAMFVFYSGHGAHDEQGHWLAMPDGSKLYRATILDAMKRKGVRLAVLLTDSCNEFHPGTTGRPKNLPSVRSPNRITPLFDELFFRQQGVLDANSASEGEISLGPDEGGLLTLALAYPNLLNPRLTGVLFSKQNQRVSWQTVLDEANRSAKASYAAIASDGVRGNGKTYTTQTVRIWSLPQRIGGTQ